MAVNCPHCGNLIDQDFGVVTCPSCHRVLLIDMDGEIQSAEPSISHVHDLGPELSPEQDLNLPGDTATVPPGELPFHSPAEAQPEEFPAAPVPLEDPTYFDEPLQPMSQPNLNDLSDVSDFANSDLASGPLSYSVMIENIDTKEMRTLVIEALDDSKFQWNAKELLKQIKGGRLELKDLNPVKASVIVQRLRDLPVKVSWKQNVYS